MAVKWVTTYGCCPGVMTYGFCLGGGRFDLLPFKTPRLICMLCIICGTLEERFVSELCQLYVYQLCKIKWRLLVNENV